MSVPRQTRASSSFSPLLFPSRARGTSIAGSKQREEKRRKADRLQTRRVCSPSSSLLPLLQFYDAEREVLSLPPPSSPTVTPEGERGIGPARGEGGNHCVCGRRLRCLPSFLPFSGSLPSSALLAPSLVPLGSIATIFHNRERYAWTLLLRHCSTTIISRSRVAQEKNTHSKTTRQGAKKRTAAKVKPSAPLLIHTYICYCCTQNRVHA